MAARLIYLVCGHMGDPRYETFEQWIATAIDGEHIVAMLRADQLQEQARLHVLRAQRWADRKRERLEQVDPAAWVTDHMKRGWRSRNPFTADPKFDPFNSDAGGVHYYVEPVALESRR